MERIRGVILLFFVKSRSARVQWAFTCLGLFFLSGVTTFAQAVDWPTLGFAQVVTNTFTHPTVITHAGDGSQRLFILQQPGQILIVQNSNVLAQPFLDISSRTLTTGAEQGLLGLAFPPGFSINNHFYVDYTRKPDGAIVISRFFLTSTNSNVADTNSEQVVLVIPKPVPSTTYNNHNAGQLAFGPDGYLYIGVGDGGSEGDPLNYGQSTNTFYGKILRIDVESGASPYAIPPSNPFVSKPGYKPETWAWGLRNPWRFSFDDLTGDLYIGDVGQNMYEEVDFQPAGSPGGQNYGWRIMEGFSNYKVPSGFTNFASLTLPVAVYSHLSLPTDLSGAVIGGYIYRGPNQPRMNGMYFYGDFIAGWIWGLKQVSTNWQNQVLINPTSASHFMISTFGEDDSGQLYLADYYAGKIYQIQDTLQTWTPAFSPSSGVINSSAVIVTCLTTNAEIHYTTNGLDPTISDPIVASGGSILVTSGFTNKARAFRSDLSPSGVAMAIYTEQVGTPIFSPPAGPITSNSLVSISTATPGAAIYYTADGTTPTTNSTLYTGPLTLSGGITIKALGVASSYNNSSVAAASYSAAQAATPVFSPSSGPITNGASILMSSTTPGAAIYYTLDGSTPTTSSTVYTGPVTINGGTTVNAFAAANNYVNSSVQSTFYQLVSTATPVFSPSSGPITNGTTISMSCATPDSSIFYTLDGTTPTTNSPVYAGPFEINGGTTVSAFATASQYLNSSAQSIFYQLVQTATPAFNPSSGPITNGTPIAITCATANSTIYYTLDGTTPTTNSAINSEPLVINGGTTVSALAAAYGYLNSSVQSVFYQLVQTATPQFNPPSGPITNGTPIAITCATPNSTIYYTLDGTTPATNSAIYTEPITINGATTLNAFATANQYLNSSVQSESYQITQVSTPTFTPPNGPVSQGTAISISCATPGNMIFYTLDGTTPTTNSEVYSAPLPITTDTTVSAMAIAPAELNSSVRSVLFTLLQAATPAFNPSQGPLTNGALISITSASSNAIIRYTVDGSTPSSTNGFIYSIPLLFTNPMTLNAYAVRSDLDPSSIQSGYFSLMDIENTVVTTLAGSQTAGFSNGFGASASFSTPEGICIDKSGNLYVADTGNNVIRKIAPPNQVITFAGTGIAGSQLGNKTNTQFSGPTSVTMNNSGDLYVVDAKNYRICVISPTGAVGNFYRPGATPAFWQIEADPAGNLDLGSGLAVEQIAPNGSAATLSGYFNLASADTECELGWCPHVGIGVDASANVYATTSALIYKIGPNGTVLFAGQPPTNYGAPRSGYSDGSSLLAWFDDPQDATVDAYTNVFVGDTTRVRKISFNGWVSTMAGNGTNGYQNGSGFQAEFNGADGLCMDTNGNIFVADSGNNCIREISPDTYGIGIADWWQLKYFGYVGINPNIDANNNGMTAYEDFWAGLNPTNPASVFKIESASVAYSGTTISWDSVLGKNYTVQWSSNLVTWNTLGNPVPGNGSLASITDSTPGQQNRQRFYRVVVDL